MPYEWVGRVVMDPHRRRRMRVTDDPAGPLSTELQSDSRVLFCRGSARSGGERRHRRIEYTCELINTRNEQYSLREKVTCLAKFKQDTLLLRFHYNR